MKNHFRDKVSKLLKNILPTEPNYGEGREKVLLFETRVAGVQYNPGSERLNELKIGQVLKLVTEPQNEYDTNAISVYTLEGIKLGYIPKTSNSLPKIIVDEGVELIGEIKDCTSKTNPTKFIKIAVFQLI